MLVDSFIYSFEYFHCLSYCNLILTTSGMALESIGRYLLSKM